MTTFCRIVLTVVSCTIDPATPAPTPAEAVAIFRASSPPFQAVTEIEPLPWYADAPIAYDPDWPFPPAFAPTLFLEPAWAPTLRHRHGIAVWDRQMFYGLAPGVYGGRYGQTVRVQQPGAGRPLRRGVPDARTPGAPPPLRAGDSRATESRSGAAGRPVAAPAGGRARPGAGGGVGGTAVRNRR